MRWWTWRRRRVRAAELLAEPREVEPERTGHRDDTLHLRQQLFAALFVTVGRRHLCDVYLCATALQLSRDAIEVIHTQQAIEPQNTVYQHDGVACPGFGAGGHARGLHSAPAANRPQERGDDQDTALQSGALTHGAPPW